MKTKLASAVAAFLVGMSASATIHPPPCVGQACPAAAVKCGPGKLDSCPEEQKDLKPKVPNG